MIKKILCRIFKHNFKVIQTFKHVHVQRLRCQRCKKDFAINHNIKAMLPWDEELEELYRALGNTIIEPQFTDGTPTFDFQLVQNAYLKQLEK